MPCFNPIEKLQSVEWNRYQGIAISGQMASGLIVAITAIAFAVISIIQPDVSYLAANHQAMITLAVVAGVSLVTFATCACIHYCGLRRMQNAIENQQCLEQIRSETETVEENNCNTVEEITTLNENPIDYIKQIVSRPATNGHPSILQIFKRAVKSVVIADCKKTGAKIGNKSKQIDEAFEKGEKLFNLYMDNPRIFVTEMLRYFGPTKKEPTIALRRVISAYNSGDAAKLEEVQKEYTAILSSQNFTQIVDALNNRSDADLMLEMPTLLEALFSLPDEDIKILGRKVLNDIFEKTRTHPEVLQALGELKREAVNSSDFALHLEKFVAFVLDKAEVPDTQMKEWGDDLIKFMLHTTFKKRMCSLLHLLSLNIRILKLMFKQDINKESLFISIDKTFLLSESSDCIKMKALQEDILELQGALNYGRQENAKIALIALKETDARDYNALIEKEDVIRYCFQAKNVRANRNELQNITASERVKKLGSKYQVRLIAVPVSITDHPFKKFKEQEKLITAGAWAAKFAASIPGLLSFVSDQVKPKLVSILPKMEGQNLDDFNSLIDTLLTVMLNPIYDGALGDTPFRETFEEIITNRGEELAIQLDKLILDEELSFEKIRDTWAKAMANISQEFENVYTQELENV